MILFQYPLNLHCSQTKCKSTRFSGRFQYPLNLHCSQTNSQNNLTPNPFQYPLNLHCSQTTWNLLLEFQCFNTLWIYTALKQVITRKTPFIVSIPSEFTLLSNICHLDPRSIRFQYPLNLHCSQTLFSKSYQLFCVSIPSEFTLLSNLSYGFPIFLGVSIPSEFTLLSNYRTIIQDYNPFQYPLNLHCSQTIVITKKHRIWFQYPLNLHCSQTE